MQGHPATVSWESPGYRDKVIILLWRLSNLRNAGDLGSIPELGRSPGEGKGYPLHYAGLENSMDYTVHGVAKSWT